MNLGGEQAAVQNPCPRYAMVAGWILLAQDKASIGPGCRIVRRILLD